MSRTNYVIFLICIDYYFINVHRGNQVSGGFDFSRPPPPAQQPSIPQLPIPQPPAPPTTQDPSTLGCGTPPLGCPNTKYRSLDGSCNNLQNPIWGTPNTRYNRLLPANYADGNYFKLSRFHLFKVFSCLFNVT